MKYFPLMWAGLARKPARTIFTALSIVVAFVLLGVLGGIDASVRHVMSLSRLDRLTTTAFGILPPVSYADQIRKVPGVTLVALENNVQGYWQDPKNAVTIYTADDQYFDAHPELKIAGDQLTTFKRIRTGILVPAAQAKRYGWRLGNKIPVIVSSIPQMSGSTVWTFDVVGVVENSDFPDREFGIAHYSYFNEARALNKDVVYGFVVRVRDAAQATDIGQAIDELFASSAAQTITRSERAVANGYQNNLFDVGFFIEAVTASAFFALLFVTANTMVQSVEERLHELGVLKTLGFTDGNIFALVIGEAVALCIPAAVLGLVIAIFVMPLAAEQIGNGGQMLPVVFLYGAVAALLLAFVSGSVPGWRANRLKIVDALATQQA